MTDHAPSPAHPIRDHTGWSDSSARAVLQLMADSVAEMAGFEAVALSVILEGVFVSVAYAGPEEHRETVFNQLDPVEGVLPVLDRAESWGRFRFLAAEDQEVAPEGTWVEVVTEAADVPDAWHPHDILVAPLFDEPGELIGLLSVDGPVSGRRPSGPQRDLLNRYAAQAERALQTAFEREALVRQVAHGEAARRLVRTASLRADSSLREVLVDSHYPLVEGFDAEGTWLCVFDDDETVGHARWRGGQIEEVTDATNASARMLARSLWAEQAVLVTSDGESHGLREGTVPAMAADRLLTQVRQVNPEVTRVLMVPVGAGRHFLGQLMLTRLSEQDPWSSVEIEAARAIGHDLGAALLAAQALERKRRLVRELEELNHYRSQLISTLSHELRTPLTVITGNLELLGELSLEEPAEAYRQAMTRGAERMERLVANMILLARFSHPGNPRTLVPVSLDTVVDEVVDLLESSERTTGVELSVSRDSRPSLVRGDPTELDRLVANLVGNAVKYTHAGGSVRIELRHVEDSVVLRVIDEGIGISAADRARIFDPLFRSADPLAQREQGTGLGLALVKTILERQQGRIEVDSVPGEGSTFTVTLPGV